MGTSYDAAFDLPLEIQGDIDIDYATYINSIQSRIVAIEEAVGLNPAGSYDTVRARLDHLQTIRGG